MRSSYRLGTLMKQIQGSATTGSVWKYWAGVKAFNHWLHESWKSYGEIDKIANIGLLNRISLWRTTGKVKIKSLLENQKCFHDQPEISLVELHALLSQLLSSDRRWRPARWGWWKDPEFQWNAKKSQKGKEGFARWGWWKGPEKYIKDHKKEY